MPPLSFFSSGGDGDGGVPKAIQRNDDGDDGTPIHRDDGDDGIRLRYGDGGGSPSPLSLSERAAYRQLAIKTLHPE